VRRPFEDEEREIAVVLRVMSIERKLLLAICRIIRMVDIQDNGSRGLGGAGDEMGDEGPREPREVFTVDLMVQPGERGGTGQVLLRVQRRPLDAQFEQRIPT